MKCHPLLSATALMAALFALPVHPGFGAEAPLEKEKLQIVFCLGQSNMVGVADVKTAWYLTQPQYVPPREACLTKSRFFDWSFYWSGVRYYEGTRKAELDELVEARQKSRMKWRQRVNGVNTAPFYPQEFDLHTQVLRAYPPESPEHKEALLLRQRAVSEKGFHYHGSAKFFLLNGDALARSLAGLMAK